MSTRKKCLDQNTLMRKLPKFTKKLPFTSIDIAVRAKYRESQKLLTVQPVITVLWAMIIIAHFSTIVLASEM